MRRILKIALAGVIAICAALPVRAQYSGGSVTINSASNSYAGGILTLENSSALNSVSLMKSGVGTLTLSSANANTYTGAIIVDAGRLNVSGSNSYTGTTTINSGTLQLGTVQLNGMASRGAVSGTANLSLNGASNITFAGGTLQLGNHPIAINSGSLTLNGGTLGGLVHSATLPPVGPFLPNSTNATWSPSLTTGQFPFTATPLSTLVRSGTGTLVLTGVNTFSNNPILSVGAPFVNNVHTFATAVPAGYSLQLASGGTLKVAAPATLSFAVVPEPPTIVPAVCGFVALGATALRRRFKDRRNRL